MTSLGIDARALRSVWTVFLFLLALGLVYLTAHTLIVFTLAVFFAHLLGPVVSRMDQWTPRQLSRNTALALVYLLLVGMFTAILIPLTSTVVEQASGLAARLPSIIQPATTGDDPLNSIPLPSWLEPQRAKVIGFAREKLTSLDEAAGPLLKEIGSGILSGIGNLLAFILIPILSFFFLKDGAEIRTSIVSQFSERQQPTVDHILEDLSTLLRQYIGALVTLSAVVFLVYAVLLSVMGVQYSVLLATGAALLEFIPVVGPLAASAVIIIVAGITGYSHMLWVVIFLVLFRLVQDYVISPHLMSSGVEVHPLLVLFGVLAGEQVAGIPGMFFSVPLIAALRIVIGRLRQSRISMTETETHA